MNFTNFFVIYICIHQFLILLIMNAKTLFLFVFCLVGISGMCITTDPPTGLQEIHLNGKLDLNHGLNDIETYTDQVNVYVVFHRGFGVVSITLFNELGVSVYSDVVDTAIQQTVVIPISGKPSGIYSVLLESALGYSEGDFSKTN